MTDIFEDIDQEPQPDEDHSRKWQPEKRWRQSRSGTYALAGAFAFFLIAVIVVINTFAGIATSSANQSLDSFNKATKGIDMIVNADGTIEDLNQTYSEMTGETKKNVGDARMVAETIKKTGFQPLEKGLSAQESAQRVTLYFSLCDLMADVPQVNVNSTTLSIVKICEVYKARVEDLTKKFNNYDFMRKFRFVVLPFVANMSQPMPALFVKE